MTSTVYPASPTDVPRKLTGLSTTYMVKAGLAILAILLFFVLYFALVIALGYLFYLALIFPIGKVGIYPLLLKLGAIAGAGMLLLFTIKFLFKLRNPVRTNRIKLVKEEHPQLWEFVKRICKETGAPFPKSIYVDPDVNAYVSYTNMWLSLILPVRKELTIGLGLVHCLNLSQFKAVIAHEFGHFAQRSMKIGSYIASANTIIHDMIFTRDKWDQLLEEWKSADLRLSIAAWVITPIIWLIRQALRLFYSFLNIMYSSLSREMEFNADKVAVSVTGSEAIVSALWRLNSGFELWNNTVGHAYVATQKGIHSRNLYEQLSIANSRTEAEYRAALEALPTDDRGGQQYFFDSEASRTSMYASHPPNDAREANAKTPFIHCPVDEGSPWILFSNSTSLQEQMTALVYEIYLQKTPDNFVDAEEFDRFSIAELDGKDLIESYENTFEERFLYIPTKEEMEASPAYSVDIAEGLQGLEDEIKVLMKPVQETKALMEKVHHIADGRSKEKSIVFNGVTYGKKELQLALNAMVKAQEELFANTLTAWDIAFCTLHLRLAEKIGRKEELEQLYTQHNAITLIFRRILHAKTGLLNELAGLQQMEEVEEYHIRDYGNLVREVFEKLNEEIAALTDITFVPLPNIDTVQELQHAIIDNGTLIVEEGSIFEEGRFDRAMHTLERAAFHCRRLDEKSLAQVLRLHAELRESFGG